LLSEAPPDTDPIIDDSFVELVWQWVSRNPEVTVDGEPHSGMVTESADNEGESQAIDGTKLDKYRNQRLCTGEDRVWYAIAGHGIDYKRIPPLEFQALSVVAAHGTKGVLQPDVTKITGQDKRSLPKRTDNLSKNGYIIKTNVIARGTKTSLLKLKKFAGDNEMPEDEGAPAGSVIIQYNLWFDEVMRMLKENDNIMAFEDIRIGLGINGKRFETRALHRCVRRLANVGCLRKLTARVEAPASQPDADMKSVRSLHLVREPTEIDRIAFMRSDWQRSKLISPALIAQYTESGTLEEDEDEDEEAEIAQLDGESGNPKGYLHRSPPMWEPDVPFPNFMYNRIQAAGIAGTSSGELYDECIGQFWKRAMDEMLVKLTDLWQYSQPPHLRYLSIVKDTGQRGKQPTFQYRTYENFVKAVEIGDAFWEGVFGVDGNSKAKSSKKKAEAAASAMPDLDEWGFPKVNPKFFAGRNGAATLEECRRNAKNGTRPGSMLYHRIKPTGKYIGRPKKKQPQPQIEDGTSTGSAQQEGGEPGSADLLANTPTPRKQKTKASAAKKRTAVQANLDVSGENNEKDEPEVVAEPQEEPASSRKKRPRKSVPDVQSPKTPATQDKSAARSAALDGSPVSTKRARPAKAVVTETEPARKEAEEPASAEQAQQQTVDGSHDQPEQAPIVIVKAAIEINPPGALELKRRCLKKIGRAKKAKIAVFRSSRLHELPWYVREDIPPPPRTPVKRTPKPKGLQSQQKTITKSLLSQQVDPEVGTPQETQTPVPAGRTAVDLEDTKPGAQAETPEMNPQPSPPGELAELIRDLQHVTKEDNTPVPEDPTPDTAPQDEPAEREEPAEQDESAEQNEPTEPVERIEQDETIERDERVAQGESAEQNGPTEQDETIEQDEPTEQDEKVAQNEPITQDEPITQGKPIAQGEPVSQDEPAEQDTGASLPDVTVLDAPSQDAPREYKKVGMTKNIGALHIKRRKMVMDIIRACGGAFPGKGEMWFPFATAWQRAHNQTPDRQTVENVMKGLIGSGSLKKLTFFFKSRKGLTVERSIYVEPEIDPNSPKVKMLQKRIIECYPATVLPEEADISQELRDQAARNPQATHNAKLAKSAGENLTTVDAGPEETPAHYIRDEFPEDNTVTVRRTANGVGLGAIDAQLQSIKQSRKLANLKRRGGSRKLIPIDPEWEEGDVELTYEQALQQSDQQLPSYMRGHPSKRGATRFRGSAFGGRRLPGRILGSKATRRAPNAMRTFGIQTKKRMPWDAIGYVASQAVHSYVEPNWMANTFKMALAPKRIDRTQWRWVDNSVTDWQVDPEGRTSDLEDEAQNDDPTGYGVMLPGHARFKKTIRLDENSDIQLAPQTLGDIVNDYVLPSSPESGSEKSEATKFYNEVDRVQAWEHHVVKAKQALAIGEDRPFINYTTPLNVPWSVEQTPDRASKRARPADDDWESPEAKRRHAQSEKQKKKRVLVRSQLPETDPRKYKKRDRRTAANFSDKDHDRLAKAVALCSVVCGGLSYRRNWLVVSHAFGYKFESEFLRHRWDKVRDTRDALVKQMQAQIWEPFLDAYERGVLPSIDYDDLEATDWPGLMEWVENEVLTSSTIDQTKPAAIMNRIPDLPKSREELRSNFQVTETRSSLNSARGDEFFTALVDKRRRDVAINYLNGVALEPSSTPAGHGEANDLLRSWARAVVLTENANYNQEEAFKKITKFGDRMLDSTVRDLCAEKILLVKKKGRRLPGRNLKLDDGAFLVQFKRWSDKQGPEHLYLTRVAKRRADILSVLQHQDHYALDYSAEDELYVVLTNMVGQGLLKVKPRLPERNDDFNAPFPKLSAWGYSGYNYNVRTFDKTRLRFDIIYEKTPKFTFEQGLKNDVPIPMRPRLYPNEDGYRIPLWVDIHDKLLPRMWEMAFRSVLNLIVFRPGISAADIEEAHKGKIWTWEIDLLLQWMEETGVAQRTGPGREDVDGVWKGGWTVGEWWYCAGEWFGESS
jgi:hypothetical protein